MKIISLFWFFSSREKKFNFSRRKTALRETYLFQRVAFSREKSGFFDRSACLVKLPPLIQCKQIPTLKANEERREEATSGRKGRERGYRGSSVAAVYQELIRRREGCSFLFTFLFSLSLSFKSAEQAVTHKCKFQIVFIRTTRRRKRAAANDGRMRIWGMEIASLRIYFTSSPCKTLSRSPWITTSWGGKNFDSDNFSQLSKNSRLHPYYSSLNCLLFFKTLTYKKKHMHINIIPLENLMLYIFLCRTNLHANYIIRNYSLKFKIESLKYSIYIFWIASLQRRLDFDTI